LTEPFICHSFAGFKSGDKQVARIRGFGCPAAPDQFGQKKSKNLHGAGYKTAALFY